MASFRKIPSGKWRAEIVLHGVRKSATFTNRRDAMAWAVQTEESIRTGKIHADMTFGEIMEEYRQKETPKKRGCVFEDRRLRFYENDPIAALSAGSLSVKDFDEFVSRRLNTISPRTGRRLTRGTLSRDMNVLSAVLHWAMRRGYISSYPLDGFKWPVPEPHRERVATDEEIDRLCFIAGWDRKHTPKNQTQMVVAAFCLSCETGMRAGEIVAIERSWISGKVLRIPTDVTKTQQPRNIPLSAKAMEIFKLVEQADVEPRIFGLAISTREALWNKIRNKAGLGEVRDSAGHVIKEALRFHDGRATFCTRAAQKISVLDLARITGHRDLKMLMKYYRPTAEEIAEKLSGADDHGY
ncbi:site-specific integrase [Mesosutterella sp. AGMB02718]|uniref:Site-specific integrase n=1 Tax=Mesosutterella faecium TaxID=2925194 RepID=A0ABT7IM29_9BURK|nr:site-specific integrase [Mesosutterella sp. AGMB02718]MDL2058382.1 site-specific integrase [Mesosutterella sp. AGMB02718]